MILLFKYLQNTFTPKPFELWSSESSRWTICYQRGSTPSSYLIHTYLTMGYIRNQVCISLDCVLQTLSWQGSKHLSSTMDLTQWTGQRKTNTYIIGYRAFVSLAWKLQPLNLGLQLKLELMPGWVTIPIYVCNTNKRNPHCHGGVSILKTLYIKIWDSTLKLYFSFLKHSFPKLYSFLIKPKREKFKNSITWYIL